MTDKDQYYMEMALSEAYIAMQSDEVPVGCVIVYQDRVLSVAHNTRMLSQSVLGHAEINAIKEANDRMRSWLLEGCTIYITLEPCLMCVGAILQARISRIVYGAAEPKHGALGSVYDALAPHYSYNHQIEVTKGVMAEESASLLRSFFKTKRKIDDKDC